MKDKQEKKHSEGIIRNTDVWYLPDETLEAADPCPSQKQKENKEGEKKSQSESAEVVAEALRAFLGHLMGFPDLPAEPAIISRFSTLLGPSVPHQ